MQRNLKKQQSDYKIRLVSLKKIDRRQINICQLNQCKINIIWLYKQRNQLKDLEKKIKMEFKNRIHLIKCNKIQSLRSLNLFNKDISTLILLNYNYQKSILNYFSKDEKVIYLIYHDRLEQIADDFNSSKVYFMTQKQQMLYEYIKEYVEKVNQITITKEELEKRKQDKFNLEIRNQLSINTQQQKQIKNNKTLPKIINNKLFISPKKEFIFTKPQFLNSNYQYPGPGEYDLTKGQTKWSKKFNNKDLSPKITDTLKADKSLRQR